MCRCPKNPYPPPPADSISLLLELSAAEHTTLLCTFLSLPSPSSMCRCPKNPYPPPPADSISLLLELSAADDLSAFKLTLKSTNLPLGSSAPWYSRSISPSLQMGYHLRTPLQISALYGSTSVLTYILSLKPADVNLPSVSDGATALHLAAGGGAAASLQTVKLLIEASADVDAVDAMGNRPGDVIAKQLSASTVRELEVILKAPPYPRVSSPKEKKEYPMDSTLPDIKNGIYGTDEFRMYDFKVRPCCRAYSHDWTECPFVHPGENARRRDVRKYCYSCVPCPEFRKGGCCLKGDACEYAHGVFESWLHPAQYRTRLCKDEVGCSRRVCFFAHRRDELRSVNPAMASVSGLGISSPMGVSSLDMAAALMMMQQTPGTPPMSISASSSMRPLSSRLSFRDLDFDPDLMGIEGFQQKLLDEISMNWRANSLKQAAGNFTGQQLLTGYGSNLNLNLNLSSSPGLNSSSSFGVDHSMAKAIVNSREAAFAKRSQSFIDHTVLASPPSFGLCDWVSPDGKLDWGIHGDELNKLRKSATFNLRSNVSWPKAQAMAGHVIPPIGRHQKQNQGNGAGDYLSWEQLYAEQEQLVA